MFSAFARSWQLTKIAFGAILVSRDPELLAFPLLGWLFSLDTSASGFDRNLLANAIGQR